MSMRDTSKDPRPEWLFGGNPRAIENQEAEGQQQLLESDVLPTDGLAEIAEDLGVTVLGPNGDDPLFSRVVLPDGWRKRAQNNYWTDLVDADGIARATMFYKAAFYDRRARIRKIEVSA